MKIKLLSAGLVAGLAAFGALGQSAGGGAAGGSGSAGGGATTGSGGTVGTGGAIQSGPGATATDTGVSGGQLRPGQGINQTGQGTFNTDTGVDGGRRPAINTRNDAGAANTGTGVTTGTGAGLSTGAEGSMPRVTTPGVNVGVTPSGAVGVTPSTPGMVRPGWQSLPGTPAQVNNPAGFGTNQFSIGSTPAGVAANPITPTPTNPGGILTPTSRTNSWERILHNQNDGMNQVPAGTNNGVNQTLPGGVR